MQRDPNFDQKKAAFEEMGRSLIGEQITEVRYYEIPYEGATGYRSASDEFDLVDFGVEFSLNSGQFFSLIWETRGDGLLLTTKPLTTQLINSAIWDVTQTSRWLALINRKIERVNIYWGWITKDGDKSHEDFASELEIRFDNDDSLFFVVGADEILVYFDREIAKARQIGPYRSNGGL